MIDYKRHSPSALNLFAASPAMFVLERVLGITQVVGAPAHRGKGVEDGVTHGLVNPDASFDDCVDKALTKFDSVAGLSGDPRREKYRDTIQYSLIKNVTNLLEFCLTIVFVVFGQSQLLHDVFISCEFSCDETCHSFSDVIHTNKLHLIFLYNTTSKIYL